MFALSLSAYSLAELHFPIPKYLVLNILELWEFALGICGPLAYEDI